MRKILFGLLGLLFSISANAACNLFDESQILNTNGFSINENGYYNGSFYDWNGVRFSFDNAFKENTQYILSFNGYVTDSAAIFLFNYTDGTEGRCAIRATQAIDYTCTTEPNKTLSNITTTYGSGTNTVYVKNIQLEEGTTATAYTPYYANCVERCVNMFNLSTATEGVLLYAYDGTLKNNADGFYVSDYIPVRANETYIISPAQIQTSVYGMAWYDANKQYISGTLFNYDVLRLTAPANAAYARTTYSSEWGDTFSFRPAYCSEIQVATTKYVETQFGGLSASLAAAIATVNTVVTNTINQAASIATLQSGKQTRPDETCPAYKQCLLVEDESGTPHWYQITDPFRDFVAPIIANNVNAASSTSTLGYTQLEYIESTGTQYIDTGFASSREAKFGIKFRDTLFQADKGFFGSSYWTNSLAFYMRSDTPTIRYCLNNTAFSLDITNAKHSGELISSSSGVVGTFDGQEISFPQITDNNSGDGNIYLFSGGRGRLGLKTKIDWFKIWDSSDNLVRNFVPVIDNATGKIGMYDTVGQRFYGNAASSGDDFTPGPIVDNDADVLGMTWSATWAADATTGVSAGTVSGIARCNSVTIASAEGAVATASNLSNANWNTVGANCWCGITGVDIGGEYNPESEANRWLFNYNRSAVSNCTSQCSGLCGTNIRTISAMRNPLFRM